MAWSSSSPTSMKKRTSRFGIDATCDVRNSYGGSLLASAPRQNAPLWDRTLPKIDGYLNAMYVAPSPPALVPVGGGLPGGDERVEHPRQRHRDEILRAVERQDQVAPAAANAGITGWRIGPAVAAGGVGLAGNRGCRRSVPLSCEVAAGLDSASPSE